MTEPLGIIIAGIALLLLAAYWIGRASGARSRPEAKPAVPDMAFCPQSGTDILGGCEWEPRYDLGASTLDLREINIIEESVESIAWQYCPRTYVRDVCIKCGRTAERARPVESVAGGAVGLRSVPIGGGSGGSAA